MARIEDVENGVLGMIGMLLVVDYCPNEVHWSAPMPPAGDQKGNQPVSYLYLEE